ncbi:hypothetical protein M513_13725 [Trichuris suis]|uniref:Uncharacterized protein n=1 Tax=Trichuris suis TaxID=68888 RepID=A0A085LKA2_9BILA|nr:hypothetical protein M513_13725 [Trichuris suis]
MLAVLECTSNLAHPLEADEDHRFQRPKKASFQPIRFAYFALTFAGVCMMPRLDEQKSGRSDNSEKSFRTTDLYKNVLNEATFHWLGDHRS